MIRRRMAAGNPRIDTALSADYAAYDDSQTVSRYRRASAGRGIEFLLSRLYGPTFVAAVRDALEESGSAGARLLEFGCGAGMALQYATQKLGDAGIDVELAVGADFVPAMIEAARQDADAFATEWARERLRFVVASNEALADEIANGLDVSVDSLAQTFHVAIGVNTFRYAVRRATAATVVRQLDALLARGGRVVMIDMNDRFPYGLKPKRSPNGRFAFRLGNEKLPSLDEYAEPFRNAGFEILAQRHFGWIPHSANGLRFALARAASPVLEKVVPDRAMRSLVIAKKP